MASKRTAIRKAASATLAFAILSSIVSPAFAEDAATTPVVPPKIEASAIVRDGDNLDVYVKNRPDDASNLKIYDGNDAISNSVTFKQGGIVRVNGISKSWTNLSLERWENQTDSGGIRSRTATSKTVPIMATTPEKSYLKNGARREIMREQAVYVIPVQFEKYFGDMAFSGVVKNDGVLRTRYAVSIGNGPDLPLEIPDAVTPFEAQRAYVTPTGIILKEQTLPDRYNKVTLKLDGNPVNWVTVKKESDILGNLLETAVSNDTGETFVYLRFHNVRDIKDLNLFEFTVNGQITVPEIESGTGTKSTISTGFGSSGPITLKIRPGNLGTGETAARVVAKEKSSMLYDSETVDLASLLMPKITSVDTVVGGAATTVKVNVNPASLYGDYEKLTIVLNGTGLTARGTKTTLKNADGTVKTDLYGNELYEFLNKQEFHKTNAGLEFMIETDRLKKTGNTIALKNANSGRDSTEAVFDLNASANSGSASGSAKKESFAFTPATQQPPAADPVMSSSRDVTLGSLVLTDLDPNEYYRVTAKFNVSTAYNPFMRISAGWAPVVEYGDDYGGTTFEFTDEKLGSAIQKEFPLSIGVSDFLADGTKTTMRWKEVKLEKTTGEGWKTVFTGEGQKGTFVHSVTWGKCFDGNTDVCGKNGMPTESNATFSFAFGEAAKAITETPKTPATSTGSTTTTGGKKNDPWRIAATGGNGPVGKLLDEKLGSAFKKAKEKYANDTKKRAKLTAAKKSVEQALRSAKKYEEAKTKAAKNFLKKTLIKDLKDALKKLAETSK